MRNFLILFVLSAALNSYGCGSGTVSGSADGLDEPPVQDGDGGVSDGDGGVLDADGVAADGDGGLEDGDGGLEDGDGGLEDGDGGLEDGDGGLEDGDGGLEDGDGGLEDGDGGLEDGDGGSQPVEISLGQETWASSVRDDDEQQYGSQLVVDGDVQSSWQSSWTDRSGSSVEVILPGFQSITELQLLLGEDGVGGAPGAFEVQYWDGCWQGVPGGQVSGHPADGVNFVLVPTEPLITERLRFVCLVDGRCALRQFRAWGLPSSGPATAQSCPLVAQVPKAHPDYHYALFLPAGYNDDRAASWPVIYAYHGIGGMILTPEYDAVRGSPEGLSRRLATDQTFAQTLGAIVISPHCRAPGVSSGNCWFNIDRMERMFLQLLRDFRIDSDRVIITGLSGGGIRGWPLVVRNRELLSAFIPVCADTTIYNDWGPAPDYEPVPESDGRHLCDLRDFPIWGFHGTDDSTVSYGSARATAALDANMAQRCDPSQDLFLFDPADYEGYGHAIWNPVYSRDDIYPWMLEQRISDRPQP